RWLRPRWTLCFFFQAEDGIRAFHVTGVQTCALPILPFSISLAAAPSLFDTGTTLLRVGIQGETPPEFEKKPANVVFLVDVSGSRSEERRVGKACRSEWLAVKY